MPRVDLVYDPECPNVAAARANLTRAFHRAGLTPSWTEHQIGSPDVPDRVRGFGSPTILVDGVDVAGLRPGSEHCCRVYESRRAPDEDMIARALERSSASEQGNG